MTRDIFRITRGSSQKSARVAGLKVLSGVKAGGFMTQNHTRGVMAVSR